MERKNAFLGIIFGFFLLFLLHGIALGLILGAITMLSSSGAFANAYTAIRVWIAVLRWFFLIQLVYIIPLVVWFKRRNNLGMVKGTIAGAVVTALLNGGLHLMMSEMLTR